MGSNEQNISTQPCAKKEEKEEIVRDPDFTVSCIHGRTVPGFFGQPFCIVAAKEQDFNERITINWKGAKAPLELSSNNLGKAKGNPYHFERPNLLTSETGEHTLCTLFSRFFPVQADVSYIHIPGKGSLEINTYNPVSWSLDLTYPVPSGRALKQKGGYKWDKNSKGVTTREETSGTTTDSGSTSSTTKETREIDKAKGITKTTVETSDTATTSNTYVKSGTKQVLKQYADSSRDTDALYTSGTSYTANGNSLEKTAFTTKEGDRPTEHQYARSIATRQTGSFYNKLSLTIKKNNDPWECDVMSVVVTGIAIAQKLEEFKKILEDIPKIGWYFDWEVELLQGSVSLSGGWKEYTDHRAYFGFTLSGNVKLLGLKGELGFGVSGFSIKIQAFASLGGTISMTLSGSNTKPFEEGQIAQIKAALEGGIEFTIGARFEALYMVKMEATIKSGILAAGALKNDNSTEYNAIALDVSMKFTGVIANFQVSAGIASAYGTKNKGEEIDTIKAGGLSAKQAERVRKEIKQRTEEADKLRAKSITIGSGSGINESKSVELIKPFTFYEAVWPEREFPSPDVSCTEAEIKQIINEMLQDNYFKGWRRQRPVVVARPASGDEVESRKFLLWTISKRDYITDIPTSQIAAELTGYIMGFQCICRSRKGIEAIGLAIRKAFERISDENKNSVIDFDVVLYSDYQYFIKSELQDILNNNIDYAKALLAETK
jgi:hypothetical protein